MNVGIDVEIERKISNNTAYFEANLFIDGQYVKTVQLGINFNDLLSEMDDSLRPKVKEMLINYDRSVELHKIVLYYCINIE